MIFAISALPVLAVPGWFAGLGQVFPGHHRGGQPVPRAHRPPPVTAP
jgi:hypothetical protein